jgi:hypothetical protein
MTESTLVRSQVQGAGTYKVLDFFYTASDGAEFTNYTLDVTSNGGAFLRDPARLQDDRQIDPAAAGQDGNTAGAVDTWANTVMSAAGKVDGGYVASISANPAHYQPTGSGAAPAFQRLIWDVFDTEANDDNDLNNHPDYPVDATAPYHLARILADTTATGIAIFSAFDTQSGGSPSTFQFNWGAPPNQAPTVTDAVVNNYNANLPGEPQTLTHQFAVTDPNAGQTHVFSGLTLQSYTANYGGVGPVPGYGNNPPVNPSLTPGGLFSWVTEGIPRGDYVWQVTATDNGIPPLSDNGTLTVHVTGVPEPTTLALCGLAMVGGLGLFRRRNG